MGHETELIAAGFADGGSGPGAKEGSKLPEAGNSKGTDPPLTFQTGTPP